MCGRDGMFHAAAAGCSTRRGSPRAIANRWIWEVLSYGCMGFASGIASRPCTPDETVAAVHKRLAWEDASVVLFEQHRLPPGQKAADSAPVAVSKIMNRIASFIAIGTRTGPLLGMVHFDARRPMFPRAC